MTAKNVSSDRKRSRPVEKRSKFTKIKKNKILMGVVLVVIAIVAIAAIYMVVVNIKDTDVDASGAPVAVEDFSVVAKNSENITIDVLSNDENSFNITDITNPSYGSASINGSDIYYTPSENFSGVDYFNYTVVSETGESATAKVHVIVADRNPIALFDTTMGTIVVELFEGKLPNTCENFIKLANDGFYDGMNFYRVSDDFMIQAGRYFPDGSEQQSPYGTIDFEVHEDIKHVDGAISMARSTDPNSASAEFFICDGAQSGLDGSYAAFGVTIDGIEVVRNIASQPHDNSHPAGGGKPNTDIVINSITIENQ